MLGYSRTKIRENLVESLSGITSVGGRVVAGDPEPGIGLPNITYLIESENLDYFSSSMVSDDNPSERALRITVEGRALISDGTDAPLDDLCLEIEKVIATATTLNQWCENLRIDSTEYELMEHEKPIGLATLEYVGDYREAQEVTYSNFTYARTDTTIRLAFTSSVAGKAQGVLLKSGTEFFYSDYETGSTTSHDVTITGLTSETDYLAYPKINADAFGIDKTTGPNEKDYSHLLGTVTTI